MATEAGFIDELTQYIIVAGGRSRYTQEQARALADEVVRRLKEIGVDAYPSLLDDGDLRFVYQWDLEPPVLTVMLWDDQMWRDMARLVVPVEWIGEA